MGLGDDGTRGVVDLEYWCTVQKSVYKNLSYKYQCRLAIEILCVFFVLSVVTFVVKCLNFNTKDSKFLTKNPKEI